MFESRLKLQVATLSFCMPCGLLFTCVTVVVLLLLLGIPQVGSAFNPNSRGLRELQTIASPPIQDHLFQVNNFQALDKLRETLQKNIFAIEGIVVC